MSRLLAAWHQTPRPYQVGIVVGALLFLLLLMSVAGGMVGSWKDSRFDKRESEREAQRRTLETERNEAIGRAQAAEARAKELEAQTRILEVTIAAQGERAEKAKEAIEDVEKTMQEELAAVDDGADACTRIMRLCERSKRLGLYPKNRPCSCE